MKDLLFCDRVSLLELLTAASLCIQTVTRLKLRMLVLNSSLLHFMEGP